MTNPVQEALLTAWQRRYVFAVTLAAVILLPDPLVPRLTDLGDRVHGPGARLGWAHDGCGRCSAAAGRLGDRGSRGVGRGVAVALGQAGRVVDVTARSSADGRTGHLPGTVEQTADAVTAAGGSGVAVPCDHRDDEAVRAVAARITADHGRLDLLVNNAWAGYERLNAGGRGGMERAVLGAAAGTVRRDVRRRGANVLRGGGGERAPADRDPPHMAGNGLRGGTRDRAARVRRRLCDGEDLPTTVSRWPPRSSSVSTAWPR